MGWEGCDDTTTCGNRPTFSQEFRRNVLNDFTFHRGTKEAPDSFKVTKNAGKRAAPTDTSQGGWGAGCGRRINWANMAVVTSGPGWAISDIVDAAAASVTLSDVKMVQAKGQASFDEVYEKALKKTEASRNSQNAQARAVVHGGS